MLKIVVDFNNMTADGERVLVATNTERDKDVFAQLSPDLRVLLHEVQDFEVEAIVQPEEVFEGEIWWYGTLDWATRHDLI